MITYRIQKILRLAGGRIGLTDKLAARRKSCLISLGSGVYEIMAPVEFKVGEIIGLDEIPKTLNPYLETSEDAAAVAENKLAANGAAPKAAAPSLAAGKNKP